MEQPEMINVGVIPVTLIHELQNYFQNEAHLPTSMREALKFSNALSQISMTQIPAQPPQATRPQEETPKPVSESMIKEVGKKK